MNDQSHQITINLKYDHFAPSSFYSLFNTLIRASTWLSPRHLYIKNRTGSASSDRKLVNWIFVRYGSSTKLGMLRTGGWVTRFTFEKSLEKNAEKEEEKIGRREGKEKKICKRKENF